MQETWEMQVRSLGREEDALEKERAEHSSSLAWEPRGQRSLAGYPLPLSTHMKPVSCLIDCHLFEVSSHNRRDVGALWVLVFTVTKIVHVGPTVMIQSPF